MSDFPYNLILTLNLVLWLVVALYMKRNTRGLHWFIAFSFITDSLLFLMYKGVPTAPLTPAIVSNTFLLVQFFYLHFVVFREVEGDLLARILPWIVALGSVVGGYLILQHGFKDRINIPLLIVTSVSNIVAALLFFLHLIRRPRKEKIQAYCFFYIITAQLGWNLFALFNFIPLHLFNFRDKGFLLFMDRMFNIVNVVTYSLYLVAAICLAFPKKSNSPTW